MSFAFIFFIMALLSLASLLRPKYRRKVIEQNEIFLDIFYCIKLTRCSFFSQSLSIHFVN
nr:MAG TPA: hypothetical protein [Bacteriophage sp.]